MTKEGNSIHYSSLVSIITPSYNSEKYISETIESVLTQTYSNWEMLIVDDMSTDDSLQIIKAYTKKDSRIKLIRSERNLGPAKARNRAIKEANGKYIAFLDSDDIWLHNKLEKHLTLMQENNIYLSYSAYYTMNNQGDILSIFPVKKKINYHDMLKTSTIGTLTTVYNARKLGKFYFETLGHEDYIMKLQILKVIPHAEGINEPLAKYRIHEQSLSSNKLHAALWQWNIYRKVEKLPLFRSIYYFLHYAYYGIFKYR